MFLTSSPATLPLWSLFNLMVEPVITGTILGTVILALGGATGGALNPARDFGPRLAHTLLSLGCHSNSEWGESDRRVLVTSGRRVSSDTSTQTYSKQISVVGLHPRTGAALDDSVGADPSLADLFQMRVEFVSVIAIFFF